jgi:hypothetical protein
MASGEMDRVQFTGFFQSSLSQMAAMRVTGRTFSPVWIGAT